MNPTSNAKAPESALDRFFGEVTRRSLTDAQAADALGMSPTTVSRVRRGIYEGDLAAVSERAALALRLWQEREACHAIPYIETSIARQIHAACDFALTRQTPVILTGLSQLGKTTALEHYASQSDAPVHIVRMPAAASMQGFCSALAEAMRLPLLRNVADRRAKILATLNPRTLLVVDEFHELVVSATRTQTRRVAELIRECYDRTRCGLVLCGTDSVETDLLQGPDAGLLDQIVQRAIAVRLPRQIPEQDILKVTLAAGFPANPPSEILRELKSLRMNRLTLLCAMTAEAAAKRNQSPSWELWRQTRTALLGI